MTEEGPRVTLEDNDDGKAPESTATAAEGATEAAQQPEGSKGKEGSKSYAPRQYGDAVGDKMQSVMSPVGKPLGKGLGTIASPVGGLVDPIVGGINRGGAAVGAVTGLGAGNMEHKNREEDEEMHKPYGGKEQTGENPLGL